MASQVGAAAPDGDNPHLAIMQKFSRKAEEERQIEQERKRLEGTMLESKKVQEAVIQDGANLHHVILGKLYACMKRSFSRIVSLFCSPIRRAEAPARVGRARKVRSPCVHCMFSPIIPGERSSSSATRGGIAQSRRRLSSALRGPSSRCVDQLRHARTLLLIPV